MTLNDVGLFLIWSAVRASLFLIPVAILHLLASRRGPDSGAWVAATGLAVVVLLACAMAVRPGRESVPIAAENVPRTQKESNIPIASDRPSENVSVSTSERPGYTLDRLRGLWNRFERGAATPADRCRDWGSLLAVVVLVGIAAGLIHILVGIWVVHLLRRRGRLVIDPELSDLAEEFSRALGLRRAIEIREVPGLPGPATAGWVRPVLLLPDDWRIWSIAERRAVLAHELAHVCRDDFATALVARLAVALHFYHPTVHWLFARLQWQQELAADALGAALSGGNRSYVQSLSKLALRQDGRIPSWPVRAFLPSRGTLIRRIAMLRNESERPTFSWSRPRRWLSALALLGIALAVTALRGPALGDDEPKPAPSRPVAADPGKFALGELEIQGVERRKNADPSRLAPFDLSYMSGQESNGFHVKGVAAFRPGAAFRRPGMNTFSSLIDSAFADMIDKLGKGLKIGPEIREKSKIGIADIEQVVCGAGFKSIHQTGKEMTAFGLGGLMVRMARPIDAQALIRGWGVALTEVREGNKLYYRFPAALMPFFGKDFCVHFPDDRTIVCDVEAGIRKILLREKPSAPDFARGDDWDRVSRGLFAVALDNRDGFFRVSEGDMSKEDKEELGRYKPLYENARRMVFGADDADGLAIQFAAATADRNASAAVGKAVDFLLDSIRKGLDDPKSKPFGAHPEVALRMLKALVTNSRVERSEHEVFVRCDRLGPLTDFASIATDAIVRDLMGE